AAAGRAGRARSVITREPGREFAGRAVGPCVVAEARTAGPDRGAENQANGAHKSNCALVAYGGSHASGRNPGVEQRFADIDVAETGDRALVEERGFNGRAPSV